jgi:NADPH:quinone reductase-like Zn-dependent oxidoreductase
LIFYFILFQVGDKVVALPEYRAWAELVAVPAKFVYSIPENMTPQEAVAITMNYLVAYILVFDMANVAPGKSVLLHSAGGSVVSHNIIFRRRYFSPF